MEGFAITHDPKLDDEDRFQVYMGHFPTAASVQSLLHFAQSIKDHNFSLYKYPTDKENLEHYGQTYPPLITPNNIRTPTAMFVGDVDDLGDPTDNRWARDTINSGYNAVVHYEEIHGGHASFIVGKDMSWFDRAMELIAKYNPK